MVKTTNKPTTHSAILLGVNFRQLNKKNRHKRQAELAILQEHLEPYQETRGVWDPGSE